jgi:glutathione S-transferase
MPTPAITLYGLRLSGHSHRVELFLSLLGLPYRFVEAWPPTPDLIRLNPLGQIPVLTDGETVLADSNAILVYLAATYAPGGGWMPSDPLGAAAVQRWLSVAAGEVRFGPALARIIAVFGVEADADRAKAIAARLLAFMDSHLTGRDFLAADHPTLADIACYSYVAHAPEGGVSLAPYPAIRAWIGRVEALPGFLAMPASPIPDGV